MGLIKGDTRSLDYSSSAGAKDTVYLLTSGFSKKTDVVRN